MLRYDWTSLSAAERTRVLARPDQRSAPEVITFVQRLFGEVSAEGEQALKSWSTQLDGREPYELQLRSEIVDAARARLAAEDLAAIEFAVEQVRFYHEATKPQPRLIETAPGIRCTQLWKPIRTCGLYVPAGSAPLVSTLIMLAEPARVAGVPERIVVTPPGQTGEPHPAMIAAAAACGLDRLFVIGGAQAIAALALGVFTPKASKIFGPGNAYVAEAKRYAASLPNGPAIDLPAGPSELMVIADRTADAAMVAADLLSQAEHDADAQVLLVSTSAELIADVQLELVKQAPGLPRAAIVERSIAQARAIHVSSVEEAVAVANDYAPEHLSLQTADAATVAADIDNAGAIFIGRFSAETFGDYVAGPSHVLPTDAAAKAYGGVSVASFMKSYTVQEIDADGARKLAPHASRLARLEGLEAHARAADIRVQSAADAPAPVDVMRRRVGDVERKTRETAIRARVDLDSAAPVRITTGVGFFDHMLEQVAHHGGFSLTLSCEGDLHIDAHHTIEDCAIAFGQALKQALSERKGIARFGFLLPMDETEAKVSVDLGGRAFLVFEGAFAAPLLGEYPTQMTEHVFRSIADALGATIHIAVQGENDHHKTEACFKAFGRALRQAVRIEGGGVPSTKGVIA